MFHYLYLFFAIVLAFIGLFLIVRPDISLRLSMRSARAFDATFTPGKGHYLMQRIKGFICLLLGAVTLYFFFNPRTMTSRTYVESPTTATNIAWFILFLASLGIVMSLWNIINPNFFFRHQVWMTRLFGGNLTPGSLPTMSRFKSVGVLILCLLILLVVWSKL